MGTADG
jgi:hypothetical protein